MELNRLCHLLLLCCAILALTSCSSNNDSSSDDSDNSDGSGTTVLVKGSLGQSYYQSVLSEHQIMRNGLGDMSQVTIDKVTAIPISIPFVVTSEIIENSVSVPIDSSGSFTIELDPDKTWILLLIDSDAEVKDQIVSFAGLGDQEANLIMLPGGNLIGNVDMGVLDQSGDEAFQNGSLEGNQVSFNLNIGDLREIAKLDNMLKTIKNIYINYNKTTGSFFSASFAYWWGVVPGTIKNQFSDPNNYVYDGYQPTFNAFSKELSFDGIYNHTYIVSIIPPENMIDVDLNTYSSFSSAGVWEFLKNEASGRNAGSNAKPFFILEELSRGALDISSGGAHFTNIPSGFWTIKKDDVPISYFDLSIAKPFIDSNNNIPIVYLPVLKVVVDVNNYVQAFYIKWVQYDVSSSTFVEIKDLSLLANYTEAVSMSYDDANDSNYSEIVDFQKKTETVFYPKEPFKFFGDASVKDHVLREIRLGYRIFGIDYGLMINNNYLVAID